MEVVIAALCLLPSPAHRGLHSQKGNDDDGNDNENDDDGNNDDDDDDAFDDKATAAEVWLVDSRHAYAACRLPLWILRPER